MQNTATAMALNLKTDKSTHCDSCMLSSICVPHGLTKSELHKLDEIIERPKPLRSGTLVYQDGNPFKTIYAVRTGGVATFLAKGNGDRQILSFFLPGEIFGLDGIETSVHRCNAIALDHTSYCALPYKEIDELCHLVPNLRHQVCKLMGHELNSDHQHLLLLGQQTAHEKLATFLLSLSSRLQKRGFSATEFNLPMSRHDISAYLGITVETISRLFRSFQNKGIIEVERKFINIIDMKQLKDLISDCIGNHHES